MSTLAKKTKKPQFSTSRVTGLDIFIFVLLTLAALSILIPFWNVIMISFATQREYAENPLLMWPKEPTLASYQALFADGSILTGYWNTIKLLAAGLPISLFLTVSMAYGLSRPSFPGKKPIFFLVLFTMIFNGGIVPMYLVMRDLNLTGSLWSVILAGSFSVFNMILMMNYFQGLPESLMESARLDGAGEWRILRSVVLPLAAPIMATIALFYGVAFWNSWYDAMVFLRKADQLPLQNVLRAIIVESQTNASNATSVGQGVAQSFSTGMKMAAVVVTMVPIMAFFPVLQKHFAKGVLTGAIKT